MYFCLFFDKSNLGNVKIFGMINDIGGDMIGDKYVLFNVLYYVSYVLFSMFIDFLIFYIN